MTAARGATAWAGSVRLGAATPGHEADVTDPLAGCSIPLYVDEVLTGGSGAPRVFVARETDGQRWLVALSARSGDARRWLCAPASEIAIDCVLSGRALPADLFRHSRTGTVEMITVAADGRFSESTRLCAELSDDEVPSTSRLVRHDRCA
jgi:hypothetical protein